MNENFAKILEWSVWANLDEYNDIELLLLKGHLLLEIFINNLLSSKTVSEVENLSFNMKIKYIDKLSKESGYGHNLVVALYDLNKLRNKLAHEWQFSIETSGIDSWANNVITLMPSKKHGRYTYRTRIVHAYVSLAKELLELEKKL